MANTQDPYGSSAQGNVLMKAEPLRTSKSDQQLFGEFAPVVRQLGIAADAANDAHMLLMQIERSSSDENRSDLEQGSHAARVAVQEAHRAVARYGLGQQGRRDGAFEVLLPGEWTSMMLTPESVLSVAAEVEGDVVVEMGWHADYAEIERRIGHAGDLVRVVGSRFAPTGDSWRVVARQDANPA